MTPERRILCRMLANGQCPMTLAFHTGEDPEVLKAIQHDIYRWRDIGNQRRKVPSEYSQIGQASERSYGGRA